MYRELRYSSRAPSSNLTGVPRSITPSVGCIHTCTTQQRRRLCPYNTYHGTWYCGSFPFPRTLLYNPITMAPFVTSTLPGHTGVTRRRDHGGNCRAVFRRVSMCLAGRWRSRQHLFVREPDLGGDEMCVLDLRDIRGVILGVVDIWRLC